MFVIISGISGQIHSPGDRLSAISFGHSVAAGREVAGGKAFNDEKNDALFGHRRDLFAKCEGRPDGANVVREAVDIVVEVRRELVRVVEQARGVELEQIVERAAGDGADCSYSGGSSRFGNGFRRTIETPLPASMSRMASSNERNKRCSS